MDAIINVLYLAIITTVVWFLAGALLYMNPFVAGIYKKYRRHKSMKNFSSQAKYLTGVFFVAGFFPILLSAIAYLALSPIGTAKFALLLIGVRMIPRLCDMWMQTSYPNELLMVELVNGTILCFVTALMFSVL